MKTIAQLQAELRAGNTSPTEAVQAVIDAADTLDKEVGGYLSIDSQRALTEAGEADVSLPLGGVPIAIKDLINVEGENCACSSKLLEGGYTSPYNATVINKLRAAGAIPVGRVNMDEFAMGSSTENSALQATRNPWDLERVPGGSSGGSAAVVAGGTAVAALGSDTGGSIRQPAALCGCVGLKPSYGRVSRYGLVAFASSLDQIGPMTQTVEDAAILLGAIAGADPQDSTCLDKEVPDYHAALLEKGEDLSGVKVGLPKEFFRDGTDPDVNETVQTAIEQLRSLGAETVEVSLPHTDYAVACYYIIATAEASANLARFDTVRYGNRVDEPEDLMDMYLRSRAEGFGSEVKRRILLGTYVLSSGYYDAYYLKAQKVRTLIRADFEEAFSKCDVIAGPVSPTPAFKIGEKSNDPLAMYLADIFTISANMAGICGLSVPCGFVQREGKDLPVGLHLLGKAFDETSILQVGNAYETSIRSCEWSKKVAPAAQSAQAA